MTTIKDIYTEVREGDTTTIAGEVVQVGDVKEGQYGPFRNITISDGTDKLGYLWGNPSQLDWKSIKGRRVEVRGKVKPAWNGIPQMSGQEVVFQDGEGAPDTAGGGSPGPSGPAPHAPSPSGKTTDAELVVALKSWQATLGCPALEGAPLASVLCTLAILVGDGKIVLDQQDEVPW